MNQWYRMSDRPDAESRAAIPVERDEAAHWNTPEVGYGIFLTVNEFNGARRKDCLTRVRAWAVDMDDGSKDEQRAKLMKSPLVPSWIVETKRGYQAWWAAKEGAKPQHWNALVLERLVPFFGSDKNARDLCRILRVPGYLHLKDPADPFKVRVAWKHDVAYSERQLADAFEWVPDPKAQREAHVEQRPASTTTDSGPSESLWDAIYQLDAAEALARLSGHHAVSGERYTFKPAPRGRLNIYVDGKSSPCFIDEHKRIGSPSGGGPTIAQWLRWFGHDWKTVINVLKETFPRLAEIDLAAQKARRSA